MKRLRIYVADMRSLPLLQDLDRVLSLLPVDAREKALRFVHREDRVRSAVGAFLMNRLIEQTLREDGRPTVFTIRRTVYGKPWIEEYPDLQLSLSHSGSLIVLALSPEPVGVDVEACRPLDLEMFDAFLSHQEKQEITAASDPLHAFYCVWTAREAYSKLDGRGLSMFEGEDTSFDRMQSGCMFRYFDLDGHVITVCARNLPEDLMPERLSTEKWMRLLGSCQTV